MVDLVKIRKKAKEKASDTDAPAATDVAARRVAAKQQHSETHAADQAPQPQKPSGAPAPKKGKTPLPAEKQKQPSSSEVRPPAATNEAVADARPLSVEAKSTKLERFKQQAGKRRADAATSAQGSAEKVEAGEQLELLTFAIAGEHYAVEIEQIVEIVPVRAATRVPNAAETIVGILSLRGTIVTLIDVRRRLKQAGSEETPETRIIVIEHEGEMVGFVVDQVFRVVKMAASEVEPHPVVHASEQDESIRGVFRHGESLTILLDLAKLLGGRESGRARSREAGALRR